MGICAANSLEWVVYDLALIELRAVSVAFTDDFANTDRAELVEKYGLSLLIVDRPVAGDGDFVAVMGAENANVKAVERECVAGAADRPWPRSEATSMTDDPRRWMWAEAC